MCVEASYEAAPAGIEGELREEFFGEIKIGVDVLDIVRSIAKINSYRN